ncbi:DinB family protein [Maribacter cobaltidurans]|nr:DinB family protein [Maribacter cobaltidurans]GGD72492.1 hypothetical protein GCM10011412_07680 [Maribacter cobaltidurans]
MRDLKDMENSENKDTEEYWLRGPVEGVPMLLQPATHALLQSNAELRKYLKDFPEELLWKELEGRASVGFHTQHITGVLDRMMTYAAGKALSEEQFEYLKNEGEPDYEVTANELYENFKKQVEQAIAYFKSISENTLKEERTVGRKKLPSTVLGLLFHAAEHSQRHIGQLLVTSTVLKARQEMIK